MNISDILYSGNMVSFQDLVCQTQIQTEADKQAYADKGYNIAYTESEFRAAFDAIDPAHIWYSNSILLLMLYFDPEAMLVLNPMQIMADPANKEAVNAFVEFISKTENEEPYKNYMHSAYLLPDAMRPEYFERLIEKKGDRIPGIYKVFWDIYNMSDYGFGGFSSDLIHTVIQNRTPEDAEKLKEKLEALPDVMTVYRGGGSKATPYQKAWSWTLDINVANFFATRRGDEGGYIVRGIIHKEDIIEAFLDDRYEQEVILEPGTVQVAEVLNVYGMEYIAKVLPRITKTYQHYRNILCDEIDMDEDSEYHGKEHEARVLLLCLTLAHQLKLSKKDVTALAMAAIFHDVGRDNEGEDMEHGAHGAERYAGYEEYIAETTPDPVVMFLCKYHSRPDEEGYRAIQEDPVLNKHAKRVRRLFEIFKDADGLDRIRLPGGIKELDTNQLRQDVSRQMTLVARIYLEQVKL